MKMSVRTPLSPTEEQRARLVGLQRAFSQVCNELAPTVSQTRVWNRVALHHMAYKSLRERFPELGSQLVCNAIYAVSRACRLIFQQPQSPLHYRHFEGRTLPQLRFLHTSPVYLDRHTLSLKDGMASIYTLDGRMRFQLADATHVEEAFHTSKLLEVALKRRVDEFELTFVFGLNDAPWSDAADADSEPQQDSFRTLNEHVTVEETHP